jgi:hypothetical protein
MSFAICVLDGVDDINLQQSTILENDYTAWNSGTAYVVGDRVISTTSHLIYECILNHTNQSPLIEANIGVEWVVVGPTNRWKPFDRSQSTVAVKSSGNIGYRMWTGAAVNALFLFGLLGGSVTVDHIETDAVRVNLAQYSEELDNAYWTKTRTNMNDNFALDPWNTYYADVLVEDNTVTNTHIMFGGNHSYVSGTNYTFSAYVKRGTGTRNVALLLPPAAFPGTPNADFDLGAGTAGTATNCTSGIAAAPNGYYRIWINATADASVSDYSGQFRMLSGTTFTYSGDNSSSLYIAGAQLNTGALAAYQWIRDVLTYGTRVWSETRALVDPVTGLPVVTDALFTGFSAAAEDYLVISILRTGSADTQVSEIAYGQVYGLGDWIAPHMKTFIDFSVKERNDFGTATLVRRNFAFRASYSFKFDRDLTGEYSNFLSYLRATVQVFYETTDVNNELGTFTLGYIDTFSLPVTGAPVVIGQINVESMA